MQDSDVSGRVNTQEGFKNVNRSNFEKATAIAIANIQTGIFKSLKMITKMLH